MFKKKTLHTLKMDNKAIHFQNRITCLTWNVWLRNISFQNFRKFIPGIVLKIM